MITLIRWAGYFLFLGGLVVLFGAAGNSDMDPYYPILSLILWSSLGLLCMVGGVLVINAVDHE